MIKRDCVVVGVMCGEKILVAIDQHQGSEILDLLGTVKNEGETTENAVMRALKGHIDTYDNLVNHGKFTSYITKPEGTVQLECDVYKVFVEDESKILVNPERPTAWVTRDELYKDPRNRRNNRLFDTMFRPEPVNIETHENQMGLWIDAEITDWKEL